MTKSTITRERAQQIFLGNGPEPSASEERELARMALAAMDSEPVAIIDQANLDYLRSGADADVWPPEREEMGDVLLYRHAQPAPVVPDGYVMVPKEPTKEMLDEFDSIIDYGAEDSQDAWRRLLAAAPQSPGSEPATVPGKWIPVSERMPENDGAYLCWDNRYVTTYAFIFGAWQANQFIAKNITHWMPLPAAPQEVSHG